MRDDPNAGRKHGWQTDQSLAECHNRYNRSVHLHLNFTDFFNSLRYACIALNSTSPSSRLGRVRKILQPTRFLYYFDEKKERVIYLLLLLLFIIDINNAYMEGVVYVYVFHLLVSIQATLAFEELTFLFSVLLSLLLLLLTCLICPKCPQIVLTSNVRHSFKFAHVNVNSFCSYCVYGDIYYVPVRELQATFGNVMILLILYSSKVASDKTWRKKLVFGMKSSKLILAIGQCSKCVKCAQAILSRVFHCNFCLARF